MEPSSNDMAKVNAEGHERLIKNFYTTYNMLYKSQEQLVLGRDELPCW